MIAAAAVASSLCVHGFQYYLTPTKPVSHRRLHRNYFTHRLAYGKVAVTSIPLSSTTNDDDDIEYAPSPKMTRNVKMGEVENKGTADGVALGDEDVDYPSFEDIDFATMDPLHDMTYEEYKQYLISPDTPQDELVWDDSVPTLNQLFLVGRVGNAPEARYLPDNNVVVTLSVAIPRYYNMWEREDLKIEFGQEETEWYNLECWGQLGEFVVKNVEKGTRVGVIGAIDQDYYPNKQTGKLSSNCKILVQDLDILESKMEAVSRKESQRGPSLYTSDDDDNDDELGPGSMGGFFDPF